jgi:hypothetical protein
VRIGNAGKNEGGYYNAGGNEKDEDDSKKMRSRLNTVILQSLYVPITCLNVHGCGRTLAREIDCNLNDRRLYCHAPLQQHSCLVRSHPL